jgi:glycosyltransferase involved in cell wall biosynthesis
MMRVGLMIYGSLDALTGGYLYDRKLAAHLSAHGDDVEVISLPWRNYARHLSDNVSPSLLRRLRTARLDVLLQDELNHPSLVTTNLRLRKRRTYPIVTVVHVLRAAEYLRSPLHRLYASTERRYLASVDAGVFCCQATRGAAEALLGRGMSGVVARPSCDHLTHPSSAAEVTARARQLGPLRILSVANVVPRKGLHTLLAALARVPHELWRLAVVGSLVMDPAYVRRVRRLIADAGLEANVELVGAVANSQVPAHLAASHVLVVPSSLEGLAIACLEAMRFGLPVISTTAGGVTEVVDHGQEGFLVAPGDGESLTTYLALLATDRDRLLRMGLAARRRAETLPTWDQSLEPARALLCSIVEEHRRAGTLGER